MTGGRGLRLTFAAMCLAGFFFFAYRLETGGLGAFDASVYAVVSRFISPGVTPWMEGVSMSCSVQVMGPITALLAVAAFRRRNFRFCGLMAMANVGGVWLTNFLVKLAFHRERPDFAQLVAETGYSFPSAHAMVSAAFYGYLIWLCVRFVKKPWKQLWSVLLVLLVASIAASRVYLGVHYASDVLAGLLLGSAWEIVFISLMERRNEKRAPDGARTMRRQ